MNAPMKLHSQSASAAPRYANDLDERGSVEASLMLIPTTILFLLVLQIIVAGSWQSVASTRLHSYLMSSVIDGSDTRNSYLDGGSETGLSRVTVREEGLPGDGELLFGSAKVKVPVISSLIGSEITMSASSIAVR